MPDNTARTSRRVIFTFFARVLLALTTLAGVAIVSNMKTVTVSVSSTDETRRRFVAAFKSKPQGAHISFPTVELLWKVLAPNRMALVRALTGAGVVSIREAARRVNRDVRAVHSDVTALINAGLLKRSEDGIEFPYEAVHVDFVLKAA